MENAVPLSNSGQLCVRPTSSILGTTVGRSVCLLWTQTEPKSARSRYHRLLTSPLLHVLQRGATSRFLLQPEESYPDLCVFKDLALKDV